MALNPQRNAAVSRVWEDSLAVELPIVTIGGGATYLLGARGTWGPNYKSGRPSVCEANEADGDPIAANETTGAPHAAGRGSEQSISYSFDAALEHRPSTFCSEYGAIELVGSDDNSARIGRRGAESVFRRRSGVNDTKLSTGVRRDGSRVHIGVRSTTRKANCWRPSPRRTLLSSQPQHRRNYRHSGDGHV